MRRRSMAELVVRGRQALGRRLERLQGWTFGSPSYTGVNSAGEADLNRTFHSLGAQGDGPAGIAQAIASVDSSLVEVFRKQSDGLESGRAELLGHGSVLIGSPPVWHREPLRKLDVPRLHWSRLDHLNASLVGDHKVLWEFNRLQYLVAPAFCWLLDRDRRRFELIERHLDSWLKENPPRVGVNWVSSLEIAYRAISLCWLAWMLREAPWDAALRERFTAALEQSGRHIERYLSTYFSPNTHLTGEALGLFYIATVLPRSVHSERWRRVGAEILETWVDQHVLADGVYFEQSTQYHRYTTEIYLHYELLSRGTSWDVSPRIRLALSRLFDVLRAITDGAGLIPLAGDDDGGLLLPFDYRRPDEVGSLLLCGAVALGRPDLITKIDVSPAMAFWLCGVQATKALLREGPAIPDWLDMYFPCGGTAVLRDGWMPQDAVAVVDAGPHGIGSCAHGHADALAMTLSMGTQPLFVDRGTLTYSGSERNEFRATASHNTLEIDAESGVTPTAPFRWREVPPRAHGIVYTSDSWSGFIGQAQGHSGVRSSEHRRWILHFRHGAWVILDRGKRRGAQAGIVRWQLAPGLSVRQTGPFALSILRGVRPLAMLFAPICERLTVKSRTVSQRLGHRTEAPVIELVLGCELEAMTLVVPVPEADDAPVLEKAGEATGACWGWRDRWGGHRIALDTSSVAAAGLSETALTWSVDVPDGPTVQIATLPLEFFDRGGSNGGLRVCRGIMGGWEKVEVMAPWRRQHQMYAPSPAGNS